MNCTQSSIEASNSGIGGQKSPNAASNGFLQLSAGGQIPRKLSTGHKVKQQSFAFNGQQSERINQNNRMGFNKKNSNVGLQVGKNSQQSIKNFFKGNSNSIELKSKARSTNVLGTNIQRASVTTNLGIHSTGMNNARNSGQNFTKHYLNPRPQTQLGGTEACASK